MNAPSPRKTPGTPAPPGSSAPYYQWTFKRNARTVTVNLSAEQVKPFQRAIANNRRLEGLLTEMRELSCEMLEATTRGVQKRKTKE